MNDEDFSDSQTQTNLEIRKARKKAVEEYINKRISLTAKKRNELEDQMKAFDGVDVEITMQQAMQDVNAIEAQIQALLAERMSFVEKLQEFQDKEAESEMLLSRYQELRTQYTSDIQRLNFIADGEAKTKSHPRGTTCPFCDSRIVPKKKESYIDAARAELTRIITQMNALTEVEQEMTAEKQSVTFEITQLKGKITQIEERIKAELQPKISALQEMIAKYRAYLQIKKELDVIKTFASDLETDLRTLPDEKASDVKYHPREYFTSDFQAEIDKLYMEALTECCFDPAPTTARFNTSSYDIEIDGHQKTNYQGLGYCAFINTVTSLVFRRYFAQSAKYDPGFLIVDTPLLGLDQGVEDGEPESMRSGLFRYIMNQKDVGQIIILENLIYIPELDYEAAGVNLITFTKGHSDGRYGFLEDVT